jgi:predicted outer membrane repeat protein
MKYILGFCLITILVCGNGLVCGSNVRMTGLTFPFSTSHGNPIDDISKSGSNVHMQGFPTFVSNPFFPGNPFSPGNPIDDGRDNWSTIKNLVDISDDGGVIQLNQSWYYARSNEKDILINKNLTLIGNNNTQIDALAKSRIFTISAGNHLTLINLNLRNGNSDNGGEIYSSNNASIDIINCTLKFSKALSGAAIYLSNSNQSNILNSSFTTNNVDVGYGGAIFNNNTDLTIENSAFNGNHAYFGGAIYNELFASKKTTIIDSSFESNNCEANGGAIYNVGGNGFTITGSSFKGNYANSYSSNYGEGGAIYNKGSKNFNIEETVFKGNNNAIRGGCIFNADDGEINLMSSDLNNNAAGSGAAVYNKKGAFYIAKVSNLSDNTNTDYGGAIVNKDFLKITRSILNNNKCGNNGGAIYSTAGNIIVEDSQMNNNRANYGGGISGTDTKIQLTGSEINNNFADFYGGALYSNNSQIVIDSNSRGITSFNSNKANFQGGVLFLIGKTNGNMINASLTNNLADLGGAIYYGSDMKIIDTNTTASGSVLILNNINYNNNRATNGNDIYSSFYGDVGRIGEKKITKSGAEVPTFTPGDGVPIVTAKPVYVSW